jgi:6-phosphogluconolactonase
MRENERADRQVFATVDDLALSTANWICKLALASEGRLPSVCLADRRHESFTKRSRARRLPVARSHWFWGDERFVPRDHPTATTDGK